MNESVDPLLFRVIKRTLAESMPNLMRFEVELMPTNSAFESGSVRFHTIKLEVPANSEGAPPWQVGDEFVLRITPKVKA